MWRNNGTWLWLGNWNNTFFSVDYKNIFYSTSFPFVEMSNLDGKPWMLVQLFYAIKLAFNFTTPELVVTMFFAWNASGMRRRLTQMILTLLQLCCCRGCYIRNIFGNNSNQLCAHIHSNEYIFQAQRFSWKMKQQNCFITFFKLLIATKPRVEWMLT